MGRPKAQKGPDVDTQYVRLLATEDLMLLSGSRLVSTLTWLSGDCEHAASCLQERLSKLLGTTPWLTGRIVRKQSANWLAYPTTIRPETAVNDLFTRVAPQDSPLDRLHTPMVEQSALIRHKGWTVKPKWNNPVYSVTVIPCKASPQTHFALVVSMSHIIGDGHTFYTLYNYLVGASTDSVPPQLQVTRIATSLEQLSKVTSRREALLAQSLPILLPAALGLVVGKLRALCCRTFQTTQHYLWLDATALQDGKEQATQHDDTIDYCSTNDVVTSWFLTNSSCRHGFMAVNVRGRLDGHTDQHAGNYFTLVYYRIPTDTVTPGAIRHSIGPLQRHVTASRAPSRYWLGGGTAIWTNWATFATTDRVTLGPTTRPCREELHCPLFTHQLDAHPANLVLGIVFRAKGSQLGLLICGTPSKLGRMMDPCPLAVAGDFK